MTMEKLAGLLGPMRLPFLILTPVCVSLGWATASWSADEFSALYGVLVLVGALCAHISVNTFNEYFDYKSGLDFKTERTEFSGGSGVLPARPELASATLAVAIASLVVTALIGLFLLQARGLWLLPLGALGLALVLAYTTWVTRRPFLCLIAPGLGFGPLMVVGTDFVLTGAYSWTAFLASLVPFFLVNNLLLLNQFPDIEADRSVGRRTLPIRIGRRSASLVYAAFLCCAYLSLLVGVYLGFLPAACLIGLLSLMLAIPAALGAYRHAEETPRLLPAMRFNVLLNLVTPLLIAGGLWIG